VADLRLIFNEFIRYEIELWNAIDVRLRHELDLPLTHFEPLTVIDRIDACRVYDIAAELSITTGGASKLVDRIEARGFCRRTVNPADRRSWVLRLTPEGSAVLAEARAVFDVELERRLGDALGPDQLEDFASALARLRALGRQLDRTGGSKQLPRIVEAS
jgi:DNA-binding MarR family transcriptional regulator